MCLFSSGVEYKEMGSFFLINSVQRGQVRSSLLNSKHIHQWSYQETEHEEIWFLNKHFTWSWILNPVLANTFCVWLDIFLGLTGQYIKNRENFVYFWPDICCYSEFLTGQMPMSSGFREHCCFLCNLPFPHKGHIAWPVCASNGAPRNKDSSFLS